MLILHKRRKLLFNKNSKDKNYTISKNTYSYLNLEQNGREKL